MLTIMATNKTVELPGITGEGVAPISNPEIDKLVDEYVDKRNDRMELTRRESEAKQALVAGLRAQIPEIADGLIVYRHENMTVTLKRKDGLKVRTEGEEELED